MVPHRFGPAIRFFFLTVKTSSPFNIDRADKTFSAYMTI